MEPCRSGLSTVQHLATRSAGELLDESNLEGASDQQRYCQQLARDTMRDDARERVEQERNKGHDPNGIAPLNAVSGARNWNRTSTGLSPTRSLV